MAKLLGEKTLLIRDVIKNKLDLGRKEIAWLVNGHDDWKRAEFAGHS